MTAGEAPAQALFDEIAAGYLDRPGVSFGQIWHSQGLKVGGKIFAMVVRDHLVVKLPAAQAAALVEAGEGAPFEPRPGRRMKEWVEVESVDRDRWIRLVAGAYAYGASLTGQRSAGASRLAG